MENFCDTFWRNMPPVMGRKIDAVQAETMTCGEISARGVSSLLARTAAAEGFHAQDESH
jgi:hypothetical protein